jgi:hypothetical protein
MATFVDAEVKNEADNLEEFATFEEQSAEERQPAAEENTAEAVEVETAEVESEELPEKYQGKSAAELARMHQNLESLMGKQSSEVGELRRAVDQLVQSNIASNQTPATPSAPETEFDDSEFFTDPRSSVEKILASHPSLQAAQQAAAEMSKQKALAQLQSTHPDMKDILANEAFQEWIGASKIRTDMFKKADQQYDFDSANELLSLWKERKQVVAQTKAVEKVAQKQEIKKASTGSTRANPEGKAVKKVYRRRDIIDLMNNDPKRYAALQPEIMKAYAEGRVR